MHELLAPLKIGDRIPWRLSADDEPVWLMVIEVLSDDSYLVQYPNGTTESLTDSE